MSETTTTLEAALLPDHRMATVTGEPLFDARWRVMGCTGAAPDALCFLAARIGGERWHARMTRGALDRHSAGIVVAWERASSAP